MFNDYNQVETMQIILDTIKKISSNEDLIRAAPIVFGKKDYAHKAY